MPGLSIAGGKLFWPVLHAGLIGVLCLWPGDSMPNLTYLNIWSIDKIFHLVIFFFLSVSWFNTQLFRSFELVIDLSLFGLLLEFCQTIYINNRYGEWLDCLFNSIGVLLGLFFRAKKLSIL